MVLENKIYEEFSGLRRTLWFELPLYKEIYGLALLVQWFLKSNFPNTQPYFHFFHYLLLQMDIIFHLNKQFPLMSCKKLYVVNLVEFGPLPIVLGKLKIWKVYRQFQSEKLIWVLFKKKYPKINFFQCRIWISKNGCTNPITPRCLHWISAHLQM